MTADLIAIADRVPAGKTIDEALARAVAMRKSIWREPIKEDQRIDALVKFCTRLLRGGPATGFSGCALQGLRT